MHDPNTPTAMQTPMTHEEKWAEALAYCEALLKDYCWRASGRNPELYRELLAEFGG